MSKSQQGRDGVHFVTIEDVASYNVVVRVEFDRHVINDGETHKIVYSAILDLVRSYADKEAGGSVARVLKAVGDDLGLDNNVEVGEPEQDDGTTHECDECGDVGCYACDEPPQSICPPCSGGDHEDCVSRLADGFRCDCPCKGGTVEVDDRE